jgi:tetratricopeptide (TPR) repeat protein
MPKRRADDVVHVVMTDHWIQRRKPDRDLTAPIAEAPEPDNGGAVAPFYPSSLAPPEDGLYLGVAKASVGSNRNQGIVRLSVAIAKFHPAAAEYYLQLGDALRASKRYGEAIAAYEDAVRREPELGIAHERLALGLTRVRQFARADAEFQEAERLAPRDAEIPRDAGFGYIEQNRIADAAAEFRKCLAIDPSNGLGGALMKMGDMDGAEAEFREAIRLRPHYVEAHHNLAFLLSGERRFDEAQYEFQEALRIDSAHVEARFDYSVMLAAAHREDEALRQIETVLRADPRRVKAHDFRGALLEAKGRRAEAMAEFREALRNDPEFARANFDLGAALASSGERAAAAPYLEKAAKNGDAAIRQAARQLLDRIR